MWWSDLSLPGDTLIQYWCIGYDHRTSLSFTGKGGIGVLIEIQWSDILGNRNHCLWQDARLCDIDLVGVASFHIDLQAWENLWESSRRIMWAWGWPPVKAATRAVLDCLFGLLVEICPFFILLVEICPFFILLVEICPFSVVVTELRGAPSSSIELRGAPSSSIELRGAPSSKNNKVGPSYMYTQIE
jgi:hypothetical protein